MISISSHTLLIVIQELLTKPLKESWQNECNCNWCIKLKTCIIKKHQFTCKYFQLLRHANFQKRCSSCCAARGYCWFCRTVWFRRWRWCWTCPSWSTSPYWHTCSACWGWTTDWPGNLVNMWWWRRQESETFQLNYLVSVKNRKI